MNKVTDAIQMLDGAMKEYEQMKETQKKIYDLLSESYTSTKDAENMKLKACIIELYKLRNEEVINIIKKYGIMIDDSKI